MDEFRWIQMFSCLMLMIQIVVFANEKSFFTKVGDDVTLPCLNVIDEQNNCDGTTWTFISRNKKAAEVITLGQISEKVKTKSDRLNVTANCSLRIKKLTIEDVGLYSCKQYQLGETEGHKILVHHSLFDLSVITLNEYEDNDRMTLNCSVLTYGRCRHTVKWLIKGHDVDKENNQVVTSHTDCSTTVSFPKSHFIHSPKYQLLKCEVTDTKTKRVQQFTFSQQPSDFFLLLKIVIISVGLAVLTITVVTVNIWTRTKVNKAQTDKNTVQDVNKDDAYSTVKAPSSSAAATAHPSNIYSTVSFPAI
ncbi:unnamed protein product [Oreochromis niloticus]|nr:unnamed protein product [Mustela putorius furo]